jgi:hypothetical protein
VATTYGGRVDSRRREIIVHSRADGSFVRSLSGRALLPAALLGALVGVGSYTFKYGEGSSYFSPETERRSQRRPTAGMFFAVVLFFAMALFLVTALLMNIFERKQEARNPYVRLVEVSEDTTSPDPWGMNWAREYDDCKRTVDVTRTKFGGSESLPEQKAKASPWLTRMFAGYAFSPSTTETGAATRTCSPTRKPPSESRSGLSRARACTATPPSSRPIAASATVTFSRDSKPSARWHTATRVPKW